MFSIYIKHEYRETLCIMWAIAIVNSISAAVWVHEAYCTILLYNTISYNKILVWS